MNQTRLDFTPRSDIGRARRTDPETSHEAIESIDPEHLAGQMRAIYEHLEKAPKPMTFREIHAEMPTQFGEAVAVSRRLSDLLAKRFVKQCDARPCKITGRRCVTWRVERGPR